MPNLNLSEKYYEDKKRLLHFCLALSELTGYRTDPTYLDTLTCIILWANSADDTLMIAFFYFSPKTGFDISCQLSPKQTIRVKGQILISRKNIPICRLLKILPRILSVNPASRLSYNLNKFHLIPADQNNAE